ncbi:MAG TPA: amidase [Candidatus Binatia bacterium]|nr:amidase [Candidatus Binatia bacterium]
MAEDKRQTALLWSRVEPLGWSRRGFLALLGGGVAATLAACESTVPPPSSPQTTATSAKSTELIYTSATRLAQAIRKKKVSSEEVVNAYLQRIEAINPKLNAIVQLTADTARAQAREADESLAQGKIKGQLHGVPVTIKDLFETAGVICAAGTKGRATFVPTQDATIVARLRAAGAILLGKTNVPELGLAPETDNLVYKWTDNPYDRSRTPGGSSGGEAAIIAAGGSPLGLGSDAGGSIRLPCHFCGIAGLKPNTGRVPRTGHVPPPGGALDTLWQPGPMARFVEDLILTLPIIAGVDGRDAGIIPMPLGDPRTVDLKRLRVAFYTDNGILSPTAETVATVKTAAQALSDAGLAVEEARPAGIEQSFELFYGLLGADGGAGLRMIFEMIGTTELHRLTQQRLELMRPYAISTTEFLALLFRWDQFRSAMLSFMDKYDVILCPVNAYPAMRHGTAFDDDKRPAFSYAHTYNLTGWPSVVVRGGTSPEGLPIDIQVVAGPWREDVALAVAQHIETTLGGWQPPPL